MTGKKHHIQLLAASLLRKSFLKTSLTPRSFSTQGYFFDNISYQLGTVSTLPPSYIWFVFLTKVKAST